MLAVAYECGSTRKMRVIPWAVVASLALVPVVALPAEQPSAAPGSTGSAATRATQDITAPDLAQYSVKDLRAYPWCHGTGKVADQDLLSKKYVTRNVPFPSGGVRDPEGDVECQTRITLLVAEIQPPPKDRMTRATLTLTAKSSGRLLAHQTIQVDGGFFFPPDVTTTYLPMLIFDTGCELVEVEAKVSIRKKVVGSMKKTIEFYCGE